MGKILIINGADFSDVAVEQVTPTIERIEDVSNDVEYYESLYGGKSFINAHGWLVSTAGNSTIGTKMMSCEGAYKIEISVCQFASTPTQHLVFYSDDTEYNSNETPNVDTPNFVSAIAREQGDSTGRVIKTYQVPQGAKYFRTTYFNATNRETYGEFLCKLHFIEAASNNE